MKRKTTEGLYLWEVEFSFKNYLGEKTHRALLILTSTESVKRAIQKAESVLRKSRFEWPQGRVTGVERRGQIDA